MNKKIFSSILILIGVTFFVSFFLFKSSSSDQVAIPQVKEIEEIKEEKIVKNLKTENKNTPTTRPAKKDIEVLKSKIKKPLKETDYFENIMDFEVEATTLFENYPPTTIYENSKAIVSDLADCLENFCSMQPDEDGFFDPANTVADKVINRNLELLLIVSREGNLFEFNVNDIDFEKVFASQNLSVQKNALELYLQSNKEVKDIDRLFDYADKFKDSAKAMFYTSLDLATKQDADLRGTYLNAINEDLQKASGLEKVEIIKNIKNYNLDVEEVPLALASLCQENSVKIRNIIDVTLSENGIKKSVICK